MKRFRNWFMLGGSLLVLVYLYVSDPNNGGMLAPFLGNFTVPILAVWFAHLARKALFDYIDMFGLFKKARETATGAGLAFIGICIVIFGLLGLFGANAHAGQNVKEYIPIQAYEHVSTIISEQQRLWYNHPNVFTLEV